MTTVSILILDDDLIAAEAIGSGIQLEKYQPEITCVTTLAALEQRLAEQRFDIVLLDYLLPEASLLQPLYRVRQLAPATPIIMISGKVDEATMVEAIRAGARDYIFNDKLQRLSSAVERAIDVAQLSQQYMHTALELRHSERLLAEITQRIPVAMYEFVMRPDGSTALPFVSKQFEQITGVRAEQVKHDAQAAFACVLPEDLQPLMTSIQESAVNMTHWSHDFRATNQQGEQIWLHGSSSPSLDADGSIRWHGIFEDVTELRKAYEIRDQFFSLTNDLLFITDLEGRVIKVGGSASRHLGYSEQEIIEQGITAFIHADDRDKLHSVMQQATQKQKSNTVVELRVLTRQRKILWLSWNAVLTAGNTHLFYTAHDITAHKNYETELELRVKQRTEEFEAARQIAEEANQAKTRFLSNMSHELRMPLNSILGFSQLLDLANDIQPKYKEDIHQILDAGRHLLTLVEDLLDLSLIERDKLEFHIERINVHEQLKSAVSTMMAVARDTAIRLELHSLSGSASHILADPVRFKQICLNLLSNAIKYNRPNGSVDVYFEQEDGLLAITFEDTGVGIDKQSLESLFMPFTRLNQGLHAPEGTGIGLTITKYLVEQMHGSIEVESTPGKGTKFVLRFAEVEASISAENFATPSAPGGFIPAKILYIEDSPSHIDFMHRVFESVSDEIELITANTPRLGLELARSHTPTIILMDICLPGISGFDLLTRIREDQQLRDIPVVAISANAHPTQIEKGLRLGFRRYLTKPVDVIELKRIVRELIEDRATESRV